MDDLKPCRCGNIPRVRSYRTYYMGAMVNKYYVYCDRCGREYPELGFFERSEAIEAWNRRVND